MLKVQNKVRPLLVQVTEESVKAIIDWCRDHVMQGKPTLKKHQTVAASPKPVQPQFSMPLDECPTILGKVTWQFSHGAWCVHAKDAEGKIVKTRVKASEGSYLKSGRDNYYSDRKKAYLQAIEIWNRTDKSSRERIIVDEA